LENINFRVHFEKTFQSTPHSRMAGNIVNKLYTRHRIYGP